MMQNNKDHHEIPAITVIVDGRWFITVIVDGRWSK